MSSSNLSCVVLVTGQLGTGKTYRSEKLVEGSSRKIVYNSALQVSMPGMVQLYDQKALLDVVTKAGPYDPLCVSFNPRSIRDDARFFGELMFWRGNLSVIFDETGLTWDKRGKCPDWLFNLIVRSRHRNLKLVFNALSPVDFPTDLRRQITDAYFFRTTYQDDLSQIAGYIGDDGAAIVSKLPNRSCLWWNQDTGRRKIVT